MICGCKLIVKKPFLELIVKAKASILILSKFKPKRWFFGILMVLNQLIGQPQTNLQDYGFVRISTTHLFSNWQSKKQFRNLSIGFFQASCLKMIQTIKNQFVGFVSSHKKGTLVLTSFHTHSFVVFHTDLQKTTIVTCILTSRNHMMSNMQDRLLQLVQLIQYCHASSFSTVITNEFIGEEFCLSQTSIDGYKAMGFDVTQLTQDEEQRLFTIKTNMPIPMLVYGHSFHWAKYGHHILPSSLDWTNHNKGSLH